MTLEFNKRHTIFPGSHDPNPGQPSLPAPRNNDRPGRNNEARTDSGNLSPRNSNIVEENVEAKNMKNLLLSYVKKPSPANSTYRGLNPKDEPVKQAGHHEKEKTRQPTSVSEYVSVSSKSPWDSYKILYKIQFGGDCYNIVAEGHSDKENSLVIIKRLPEPSEHLVNYLQAFQHPNILICQDIFFSERKYHIAYEFMPLSLSEVAANPLLDELRLASIIGQVLNGLLFLEDKNLEYSQLSCSNILIDLSGAIKIWGFEFLRTRSNPSWGAQILSSVMMKLMQGYEKEDGAVGVDNLDRWATDSRAVEFLSATTYVNEMSQLLKQPLLQLPWCKSRLKGMVSLANCWSSRGYKFPGV